MSSRVMSSLKDADTGIMVVPSSTRTVEGGMPAASSASPTVDPAGMSTSWLPSKPSNRIRMFVSPCTTLMWPAWGASLRAGIAVDSKSTVPWTREFESPSRRLVHT